MKANEARNLNSKYFLYDLPIIEVNDILDKIEQASSQGFLKLKIEPKYNFGRYSLEMSRLTKLYLQKLGYKIIYEVVPCEHGCEDYYVISWEKTWWDDLKEKLFFSLCTHR